MPRMDRMGGFERVRGLGREREAVNKGRDEERVYWRMKCFRSPYRVGSQETWLVNAKV